MAINSGGVPALEGTPDLTPPGRGVVQKCPRKALGKGTRAPKKIMWGYESKNDTTAVDTSVTVRVQMAPPGCG